LLHRLAAAFWEVDHHHAGVMPRESQRAARGRPGARVHPPHRHPRLLRRELVVGLPKLHGFPLAGGGGGAVGPGDVRGEHAALEVARAGGQELGVRVPGHAEHRGLVLFDGLGHPPIVFVREAAHRHAFRAGRRGKLEAIGRPPHVERGLVDAQNHQRGLPGDAWASFGGLFFPHERVAVVRASHDAVVAVVPVDAADEHVVLFIFERATHISER